VIDLLPQRVALGSAKTRVTPFRGRYAGRLKQVSRAVQTLRCVASLMVMS
jgi:hypothetical protein